MKKMDFYFNKCQFIVALCFFLLACNDERKHPTGCGFDISNYKNDVQLPSATAVLPMLEEDTAEIKVIFHVIYKNEKENIPTSALLSELEDLRLDFLKENSDTSTVFDTYKSRIGNPKIRFVLADTVLSERGVKRAIRTAHGDLYKSSPVIDPKHYLNVYTGDINSDGFVYSYPWRDPNSDAIFLYYKWVGGHYRLLSHETGHWLGLWHIFEGGCSATNDEISDTPPQSRSTGMNKPCDNSAQCISKESPMYNNFMDYSDCRCMFTTEQCKRMCGTIKKFRSEVTRSNYLTSENR